jgi:phenylpropionate dioxygenase-like ring-hydroxylating dioxygenase large terminal subunit
VTTVRIADEDVDVGATTADFGWATALPPRFYVDPAIFAREKARVFRGGWVPLARVEQLGEPGSYLAVELAGEPLVITRDKAGEIRVLANVCRHRGMVLVDGCAAGTALRCEYHLWTYHLDGTLAAAPMMRGVPGFDRESVRLPEFRHEIWLGWIFVNLDGRAEPLAARIAGLESAVADWRFEDMRIVASVEYDAPWNWKVSVENFAEFYHHMGLHRDSLTALVPAQAATCLDGDGGPWSSSWVEVTEDYLFMQGDPMPHLPPRHTTGLQIFTAFPLLCAGGQPGSTFWLQILPDTVDRHRLVWHFLVPSKRAEEGDLDAFIESSTHAMELIQTEDSAACVAVQRGLSATDTTLTSLAPLERGLWQFQRWLVDQLADPDERSR